jgi:maltooligosyltrehalose trehalohydrolase
VPFLTDISRLSDQIAKKRGRAVHLIGESHQNDRRAVLSEEHNGIGLHSQWSDDFHHALHVLLTGEGEGYYQDFSGAPDLPRIFSEGFLYQGDYAPSFGRRRGSSPEGLSGSSFVVFSQNHDQVGNRPAADRLSATIRDNKLRLAAGLTILSPFLPLLFMGEEFGESNPFHYFTSHGDKDLIESVREGRKREFNHSSEMADYFDPQGIEVFERSRLSGLDPGNRALASIKLFRFYQDLIRLRKTHPALHPPQTFPGPDCRVVSAPSELLLLVRQGGGMGLLIVANLSDRTTLPDKDLPVISGKWSKILDSEDERWGGGGALFPQFWGNLPVEKVCSPFGLAVYEEVRS